MSLLLSWLGHSHQRDNGNDDDDDNDGSGTSSPKRTAALAAVEAAMTSVSLTEPDSAAALRDSLHAAAAVANAEGVPLRRGESMKMEAGQGMLEVVDSIDAGAVAYLFR